MRAADINIEYLKPAITFKEASIQAFDLTCNVSPAVTRCTDAHPQDSHLESIIVALIINASLPYVIDPRQRLSPVLDNPEPLSGSRGVIAHNDPRGAQIKM